MYGEQSLSWLPRVCSHELLQPFATRREKSIDVGSHLHSMFSSQVIKTPTESQVNTRVVQYVFQKVLLAITLHGGVGWCMYCTLTGLHLEIVSRVG